MINENIASRSDFEALPISEGVSNKEAYFKRLHELIEENFPQFVQHDPLIMLESDVSRFENLSPDFGKYSGTPWKDVPTDYLDWLYERNIHLMKYIRYRNRKEANEELADPEYDIPEEDIPF